MVNNNLSVDTADTTGSATPPPPAAALFDVEAYSARYSGETKLERLLHIAQIASAEGQTELATQAYELLERYVKQTGNFRRYHQIFGPQRGKYERS